MEQAQPTSSGAVRSVQEVLKPDVTESIRGIDEQDPLHHPTLRCVGKCLSAMNQTIALSHKDLRVTVSSTTTLDSPKSSLARTINDSVENFHQHLFTRRILSFT
jgi:hypothetical protein